MAFFNSIPKTVLILGGEGGIGKALKNEIKENTNSSVFYTSRKNNNLNNVLQLDGLSDTSWINLCNILRERKIRFDLIINCIGILHDKKIGLFPEKSLKEVNIDNFIENIKKNTLITMLSLKYLINFIKKDQSIYASLTARLGSISDNNIGGWISYRASKAAEHMVIKTASIEYRRNYKNLISVGLHPGTVDTRLSKPYIKFSKNILTPEIAAKNLVGVLNNIETKDNGKILDYKGDIVPY